MAYLHNQYEQLFMYYTVWSRQTRRKMVKVYGVIC
jgi:hypothetical protein